MSVLVNTVQTDLLKAIDNDDLVLPTLPDVALRIRKAAENQDITIGELSRVIGSDAALSARLIKVVNSPLLRAATVVTDLHTAITRLGTNYSCNLAIGLVIEQIFHTRSDVVQAKMLNVWKDSLEVAGICYELCRRQGHLKADQGALAGLVHLIGVLPILAYAEEHNELLADPVCLDHVVESLHPVLGEKILGAWDFPQSLGMVPGHYQDLTRQVAHADYVDVVQIAHVLNSSDDNLDACIVLPAWTRLGLRGNKELLESLTDARQMFR